MNSKWIVFLGFAVGIFAGGSILWLYNQGPKPLVLFPGICIKEVNKQYVAQSGNPDFIYKVESMQIDGVNIKVYNFQDKSWTYLAKRPENYFIEGNVFSYENVDCPDATARESASLNTRLRAFRFELGKNQEGMQELQDSSYTKKRK